jgi:hypothetical protein
LRESVKRFGGEAQGARILYSGTGKSIREITVSRPLGSKNKSKAFLDVKFVKRYEKEMKALERRLVKAEKVITKLKQKVMK